MIDEDEQALRDAHDLLDGLGDIPDPGPAYWAAFPARVRAKLPARAMPSAGALPQWWSAPRLALAASLALVIAVAALGPRADVGSDFEGGAEDSLFAAFGSAPLDDWAALEGLSTTELDAMEERLLAAGKPARTPTPRPTPSATPAPASAAKRTPAADPSPLDESLEGLDDLPADRFDELLNRLDAMKT